MAGSVNKAMIIGNLGKDPEIRTFQNGGRVCNFSVATSERWKDKTTGEAKERTEWHSVTLTNEHLVEIADKYLRKGSKVFLEGQLETRKWTDKEGVERFTTSIILKPYNGSLVILEGAKGGNAEPSGGMKPAAQPMAAAGSFDNDEIPF